MQNKFIKSLNIYLHLISAVSLLGRIVQKEMIAKNSRLMLLYYCNILYFIDTNYSQKVGFVRIEQIIITIRSILCVLLLLSFCVLLLLSFCVFYFYHHSVSFTFTVISVFWIFYILREQIAQLNSA